MYILFSFNKLLFFRSAGVGFTPQQQLRVLLRRASDEEKGVGQRSI